MQPAKTYRCYLSCGPPTSQWIPPGKAKVFCAVVLVVFSRLVVGWSIDNLATPRLVTPALDMAIGNRQPNPGTAIHWDHGTQFTSRA